MDGATIVLAGDRMKEMKMSVQYKRANFVKMRKQRKSRHDGTEFPLSLQGTLMCIGRAMVNAKENAKGAQAVSAGIRSVPHFFQWGVLLAAVNLQHMT